MQPIEKSINFVLVFASLSLGTSFFMPLYQSANGKIRHADEWWLFFWSIPVLFIIFMLSNRWLKAALCFLSAIGGLLDLFLLNFLATFAYSGEIAQRFRSMPHSKEGKRAG